MDRNKSLGGSDMLRIMDGDWHQLWLEKTGRVEQEDLSDVLPVQLGIFTEEFNIEWFKKTVAFNCVVYPNVRYHQINEHVDEHPVPLRATLDGIARSGDDSYVLECKHTNERNRMSDVVEKYMPQIQLYMYMSGIKSSYLSVIFGNSRYECTKINYNHDYTTDMLHFAASFWWLVVEDREPTSADSEEAEALSTNNIQVNDMIRVDASTNNHFTSCAEQYIDTYVKHSEHETAKKELKAMVESNVREMYNDKLSIKRDKRGSLRIIMLDKKRDEE